MIITELSFSTSVQGGPSAESGWCRRFQPREQVLCWDQRCGPLTLNFVPQQGGGGAAGQRPLTELLSTVNHHKALSMTSVHNPRLVAVWSAQLDKSVNLLLQPYLILSYLILFSACSHALTFSLTLLFFFSTLFYSLSLVFF